MRTWRASLLLAEWLVQHPDVVWKKRVLELGSGVGFLGVLIAQLQLDVIRESRLINTGQENEGASLVMTDVNDAVLARCYDNTLLPSNRINNHPNIRTMQLDWVDALSEDRKKRLETRLGEINAEVMIGADIVYDLDLIPPLIETLRMGLSTDPTSPESNRRQAWIALSVRSEETLSRFIEVADARGLDVQNVDWGSSQDGIFGGGWEGETSQCHRQCRLYNVKLKRGRLR